MGSMTKETVNIPATLLLNILKEKDVLENQLDNDEFREWMLRENTLMKHLMSDQEIAKQILKRDAVFWSQCIQAVFPKNLDRTTSLDAPDSQTGADVSLRAQSVKANARLTLDQANISSGRVEVDSSSTVGDAALEIGNLTLSDRPDSSQCSQAHLTARSERGNAENRVRTLNVGGQHTTYVSESRVENGVAISGSAAVGKGIFIYGSEAGKGGVALPGNSAMGNGIFLHNRPQNFKFDAAPYAARSNTEGRREEDDKTRAATEGKDVDKEVKEGKEKSPDSAGSAFSGILQSGTTFLSGSSSKKGCASYMAKKMNLDLGDPDQKILAIAESDDKDATFTVDEISIKTSKPQPVTKNYNINKVTGSVYVENTMTSNVKSEPGADNAMFRTTIGKPPTDEKKKKVNASKK